MSQQPIIQTDIETEILRVSGIVEETVTKYRTAVEDAGRSEAFYRIEYAKAFVRHRVEDKASEKTADAMATIDCEELLLKRKLDEAWSRGLEEQNRALRAQLDAVRTLSANVRAMGG